MKRFISIISAILLLSSAVFAEDDYDGGDFYDDDYVYEQNGAGDQFLKIDISALFWSSPFISSTFSGLSKTAFRYLVTKTRWKLKL